MHHDRGGPPGTMLRATGESQQSGSKGHGAGRVVLVIEDEPNISEAIRFILRRDGWAVQTHAEGLNALEQIESLRPELVILDVMLPGRSGFDILQAMRAHPGLQQMPVLMLTAKGQTAERDLAMRAGASLFMAKPFSNAELLASVRQLVGA
ncbi:response regulator transcription factor [Pararhodobacter sp.]|uniref:response regulator transcription factor n=1 Tax=Pararhodobacter sp. TaxID=2127056 RepID=UPI003FA7E5D5